MARRPQRTRRPSHSARSAGYVIAWPAGRSANPSGPLARTRRGATQSPDRLSPSSPPNPARTRASAKRSTSTTTCTSRPCSWTRPGWAPGSRPGSGLAVGMRWDCSPSPLTRQGSLAVTWRADLQQAASSEPRRERVSFESFGRPLDSRDNLCRPPLTKKNSYETALRFRRMWGSPRLRQVTISGARPTRPARTIT